MYHHFSSSIPSDLNNKLAQYLSHTLQTNKNPHPLFANTPLPQPGIKHLVYNRKFNSDFIVLSNLKCLVYYHDFKQLCEVDCFAEDILDIQVLELGSEEKYLLLGQSSVAVLMLKSRQEKGESSEEQLLGEKEIGSEQIESHLMEDQSNLEQINTEQNSIKHLKTSCQTHPLKPEHLENLEYYTLTLHFTYLPNSQPSFPQSVIVTITAISNQSMFCHLTMFQVKISKDPLQSQEQVQINRVTYNSNKQNRVWLDLCMCNYQEGIQQSDADQSQETSQNFVSCNMIVRADNFMTKVPLTLTQGKQHYKWSIWFMTQSISHELVEQGLRHYLFQFEFALEVQLKAQMPTSSVKPQYEIKSESCEQLLTQKYQQVDQQIKQESKDPQSQPSQSFRNVITLCPQIPNQQVQTYRIFAKRIYQLPFSHQSSIIHHYHTEKRLSVHAEFQSDQILTKIIITTVTTTATLNNDTEALKIQQIEWDISDEHAQLPNKIVYTKSNLYIFGSQHVKSAAKLQKSGIVLRQVIAVDYAKKMAIMLVDQPQISITNFPLTLSKKYNKKSSSPKSNSKSAIVVLDYRSDSNQSPRIVSECQLPSQLQNNIGTMRFQSSPSLISFLELGHNSHLKPSLLDQSKKLILSTQRSSNDTHNVTLQLIQMTPKSTLYHEMMQQMIFDLDTQNNLSIDNKKQLINANQTQSYNAFKSINLESFFNHVVNSLMI